MGYDNYGDLYNIEGWGPPYFGVNKAGHISVAFAPDGPQGDLHELVCALVKRGIEAPILIRFDGILKHRIQRIQQAFDNAIKEYGYETTYRIAYPIKVNQQRSVVDIVQSSGKGHLLGLEVGSKPELLAVLSIADPVDDALLLCNGYKDASYIEIALLATKIGRRSIIIIEQFYELELVINLADKLGVEAEIGFRMRPSATGSGRWKSSTGCLAKFGLSTHEIVTAIKTLKNAGKESWVKLLHFHIGSQIPTINSINNALLEGARMYVELAKDCPCLAFFDAGGGLGIDYDGTNSSTDNSLNYSIDEYARNVVSAISDACLKESIPIPIVITESGRAITAQHSVLITEIIDVALVADGSEIIPPPISENEQLKELYALYEEVALENCREILHDATDLQRYIFEQFFHGQLSMEERAWAELVYKSLMAKIQKIATHMTSEIPEEIQKLDHQLLDIYFGNFSLFQSLPDAWAIDQLFPVIPIHRLNEYPERKGLIADLTCDSDGTIDKFVCKEKSASFLPLHVPNGHPYYLGVFFVGAYQEMLGGFHNLFGDTNAVHVDLSSDGQWKIGSVIEGDTIREVLSYVQYQTEAIGERLRSAIEKALKQGRLTPEESAVVKRKIKEALESYTYLVV
jgi:arginine decarboxylase